jgi:hypothetical protein
MRKVILQNPMRSIVAAGLVAGLFDGSTVSAQESAPNAPFSSAPPESNAVSAEAERVIVTGSHIPTAEEVGPNPVQELNRDVIEKSANAQPQSCFGVYPSPDRGCSNAQQVRVRANFSDKFGQ